MRNSQKRLLAGVFTAAMSALFVATSSAPASAVPMVHKIRSCEFVVDAYPVLPTPPGGYTDLWNVRVERTDKRDLYCEYVYRFDYQLESGEIRTVDPHPWPHGDRGETPTYGPWYTGGRFRILQVGIQLCLPDLAECTEWAYLRV